MFGLLEIINIIEIFKIQQKDGKDGVLRSLQTKNYNFQKRDES